MVSLRISDLKSQISNAFRTNPAWRERMIWSGAVALVGLVAWPAPRAAFPNSSSVPNEDRPGWRIIPSVDDPSAPNGKLEIENRKCPSRRLLTVTAYCPCARCCGAWARRPAAARKMADGSALYPLRPAVAAPDGIPFGTMLKIPGYCQGRAVEVRDRGGAIDGKRSDLDVLFPTHRQALAWGRRVVMVEIEKKN